MFLKYFVSDFEFKNKKNFFHYCVYQFEICNTNHSVNIDYVNTTEEGVLKCPKWHTEMPGDIFIVMIGGGGSCWHLEERTEMALNTTMQSTAPIAKNYPAPTVPSVEAGTTPELNRNVHYQINKMIHLRD